MERGERESGVDSDGDRAQMQLTPRLRWSAPFRDFNPTRGRLVTPARGILNSVYGFVK